jgi:hypothetical protein
MSEKAQNRRIAHPPALEEVSALTLNVNDPFFDSLKEDYPEFTTWWQKISDEGRKCWVNFWDDSNISALLAYKAEDEAVELASDSALPRKRRLKITTLKVSDRGHKVGELFIKLSVRYALQNSFHEIYLSHFTKKQDFLITLIKLYGFKNIGRNARGEDVFLKELFPDKSDLKGKSAAKISRQYWPTFCDGKVIQKFIVPIRPAFHEKLFIEGERQTSLKEHSGEFITEGNTIGKAYLSNSRIKKIVPGDILLFYRSRDKRAITTLGVVDEVHSGLEEVDRIIALAGKRTVYSKEEIGEMANKPITVILFLWHLQLPTPLQLSELRRLGILKAAPQTVMQIQHDKYALIKTASGIDGRFTVD